MESIEKPLAKRLGTVVKSLRKASGMTQEKLAQRLTADGMPTKQNTVAKLEAGQRPTSVGELGLLARIFNLKVTELVEAVFPVEHEESWVSSMRRELGEVHARRRELIILLDYLQEMTSEVRNELMEQELRGALLESYVGAESGGEPWIPARGAELDTHVQTLLEEARKVLADEERDPLEVLPPGVVERMRGDTDAQEE